MQGTRLESQWDRFELLQILATVANTRFLVLAEQIEEHSSYVEVEQEESVYVNLEENVGRGSNSPSSTKVFKGRGGRLVTVTNWGKIRAKYSDGKNHIFPVGFTSQVKSASYLDGGNTLSTYIQCIEVDEAREGRVRFCVQLAGQTRVFRAKSATAVWQQVRQLAGKKKSNKSAGGLREYGLSFPEVRSHIEKLPGSTHCKRYWQGKRGNRASLNAKKRRKL